MPVGSVSGLASGVQWRDLIDQVIAAEQARTLDPVTRQISTANAAKDSWTQYQTLAAHVRDVSNTLRDTAFDAVQPFAGTSPSGRALFSMTGSGTAVPGVYRTEVLALAKADKLGGSLVSSATTALGLTGDFYVNGTRVAVGAGDSLAAIRDHINAINVGANATGVAATILSIGSTANRLVLTAGQTGTSGIELADGTGGILAALGVVDGTATPAFTESGGSHTFRLRDTTTTIATLLGIPAAPAAATINVGNTTVTIDLAADSLDDIRDRIATAGVSAEITTESYNGATLSRLEIGAPVSAVPGNPDSASIVALLGFATLGRSAVAQVVTDASAWTDSGAGNAAATPSTSLSQLDVGGATPGLGAGDQIVISGTRGDGVAFSSTLVLSGGETVQALLDRLNTAGVLGNVSRSATVSLSGGILSITDDTAGSSQLSLSMVVTKAGGGTATLGQMTATTKGYDRELVHGSSAQVMIDGSLVTRSTNTISDAIAGVTLKLTAAEPGAAIDLPVTRDVTAMTSTMQAFVGAYNSALSFVKTQTAAGGALALNQSLRASMRTLTSTVLDTVSGLTGDYTRGATVGLAVDKTGNLSLDSAAFAAAIAANHSAVKALFGRTVTTTADLTYVSSNAKTQTGTYAVSVTSAATTPTVTGSGFTGTYTDSGVPDGISITDAVSLTTGRITLATGDTLADIIDKFNTLFTTQGMTLLATDVGGQLSITSSEFGASARFTVDLDLGNTNPTTQLGLASGLFSGTDVVGTIGGLAATGSGQVLVGGVGTSAEGLNIRFTGVAPYAGSIVHTLGLAALLSNLGDGIARSGDGIADAQAATLDARVQSLTSRTTTLQARLDSRRQLMVEQFTRMERALAILQSQTVALTNQVNALQSGSK